MKYRLDVSCIHFFTSHNFSPVASWDCKVSVEFTLQNLGGSSKPSFYFSLTDFEYYKFLHFCHTVFRILYSREVGMLGLSVIVFSNPVAYRSGAGHPCFRRTIIHPYSR